MLKHQIPASLQPILWSVDVNKLDIEKDKGYIIHQILVYGDMADVKWLFDTYGKDGVKKVFRGKPSKIYPPMVFNFIQHFLLGLENVPLDRDAYVTTIHGPVRPRSTDNF